ncbi:MAG: translation initiation factor [Muribaculaceae bacterium]|nr:translation initiation factor [Muribaculaceae bacterium]
MDWKDALKNLADNNPELALPQEAVEETKDLEQPKARPSDKLVITYERKGRKGKPATIISGFTCDDEALREVASQLKTSLAVGGSARGGEILLQGDCRDTAKDKLKKMGYRV